MLEVGKKLKGSGKIKIPINLEKSVTASAHLRKPEWIRVKLPADSGAVAKFTQVKNILRRQNLHSVCEEAACPNIGECFSHGTASFMIMGSICTRRCPFCDVGFGRPLPVDENEPAHLAQAIAQMGLKYVVITSVDRDDLRDGGAHHFARCINKIREVAAHTQIEILTPDFRGREDVALAILVKNPPDVFNHNLETVPRLYKHARPGADYEHSLCLLRDFKKALQKINPHLTIPTKSGLMVGLGERDEEIIEVMADLRRHNVDMLTIGQYLQPSKAHLPVERYVDLATFAQWQTIAEEMGFKSAAIAPLVRSSYHADLQAKEINHGNP